MKRSIRIIAVLLATMILLGNAQTGFTAHAANEQEIYYDIVDGEAIVSCQPTWVVGDIVIADTYEGYPVTGFAEPYYAYVFSEGVTSITLPNSIDAEELTGFPFCGCPSAEIIISDDNPDLCVEDNVLYNKDKTKLIRYQDNPNSKSFTIPESVAEVSQYAFGESNLEELTITNKAIKFNGRFDDSFSSHNIKTIHYNGTEAEWIANKVDENSLLFPYTTVYFEQSDSTDSSDDSSSSSSDPSSSNTLEMLVTTFELLIKSIIPVATALIKMLSKVIVTLIK